MFGSSIGGAGVHPSTAGFATAIEIAVASAIATAIAIASGQGRKVARTVKRPFSLELHGFCVEVGHGRSPGRSVLDTFLLF